MQIRRSSCIRGRWGYPSNESAGKWLTLHELAEQYLQEQEGKRASLDEYRPWNYEFIPDDEMLRTLGVIGDNSSGTFILRYWVSE